MATEPVLARDVPKLPHQTVQPVWGPGSKLNWDNDKVEPNKRKHVGIDPTGEHNSKLG